MVKSRISLESQYIIAVTHFRFNSAKFEKLPIVSKTIFYYVFYSPFHHTLAFRTKSKMLLLDQK